MITSYHCKNTPDELRSLVENANRSSNGRIGSDDIMSVLHVLETRALAFKAQGGDVLVLRRINERLEALSSQLVTR